MRVDRSCDKGMTWLSVGNSTAGAALTAGLLLGKGGRLMLGLQRVLQARGARLLLLARKGPRVPRGRR